MPVVFKPDADRDEKGEKLAAGLRAHVAYERVHALRIVLAHALLVVGIAVWLVALVPGLRSPHWVMPLLYGWGAGALVLLLVCFREYVLWRRRGQQLLGEAQPTRKAIRDMVGDLDRSLDGATRKRDG